MSENRTVLAFFVGLVIFLVLIGLVLNRVRKPSTSNKEEVKAESVTPSPTKKPGIFSGWSGLFGRKTTPTPSPSPKTKPQPTVIIMGETAEGVTPNNELKQGIYEEGQVSRTVEISTKGGVTIEATTTTIPETGAPTALLPLSLLLGGTGFYLKRRK
jgi:hypothetical protein